MTAGLRPGVGTLIGTMNETNVNHPGLRKGLSESRTDKNI